MSKEIFCKLAEELGRDSTDDEMTDATADLIDKALERFQENYKRDEYETCEGYTIIWTKRLKVNCTHCGSETDDYCIIEKGPPGENWIEDIWVRLGYEGKPVCVECYYK